MGYVFEAQDTAMDRVVALKVLPANFADDQSFQERFRREAKQPPGSMSPMSFRSMISARSIDGCL